MADDFLPRRAANARRTVTDAEIITLAIAQAIMGIPSDYRFIAVADKRLRHLFSTLPSRDGFHKRRIVLSAQIEALVAVFARESPGYTDDLLLVDSTPISAPARARRSSAAAARRCLTRWATLLTTGTAPATAACFTGFGCMPCAPSTAPPERWR
jgi:hypothetical protein